VTQKAEIRKVVVQSQIVQESLPRKNSTQKQDWQSVSSGRVPAIKVKSIRP
jgi:hypothetical protein